MLAPAGLDDRVLYRCVVGSRAYGLDGPGSDTDRRGFYLAPAALQWSFAGPPPQLEDVDGQACYWELEKFLRLALQANPTVLECLYSPLVEHAAPLAGELLAIRGGFLSTLAVASFSGYADAQFAKLERSRARDGAVHWKHAMHLLRLLISGTGLLRDGALDVAVGHHRERLLAVRRGELTWEDVLAWRAELEAGLERAAAATTLPSEPDRAAAEAFLIRARRAAAAEPNPIEVAS
jgi:predicted nucleotidyltransferase